MPITSGAPGTPAPAAPGMRGRPRRLTYLAYSIPGSSAGHGRTAGIRHGAVVARRW